MNSHHEHPATSPPPGTEAASFGSADAASFFFDALLVVACVTLGVWDAWRLAWEPHHLEERR